MERFNPDTLPEEDEFRIERHRVEVDAHEVAFTALAKHGDQEFRRSELSVELLRSVADGRELGLPKAELKPG